MDIQEITEKIEKESVVFRQIMVEMSKVVVGQKNLLERMLIGLCVTVISFWKAFPVWLRLQR